MNRPFLLVITEHELAVFTVITEHELAVFTSDYRTKLLKSRNKSRLNMRQALEATNNEYIPTYIN